MNVVLTRTLDAAPGLVWAMWTEPEHFAAWYGPNGAAVTVLAMDVRAGGERRVRMEFESPGGTMTMTFAGEHREVIDGERLVYSEWICGDDGSARSDVTEVTVTLAPADGRTVLTVTHAGVPAGSPGEAGWNMALDKLAVLLTT